MPRPSISEPIQAALVVAATLILGSCGGGKSPAPPAVGVPGSGAAPDPTIIRVTGTERLAWSQTGDASNLRFRAHVDGTAVELDSATCAGSPDPDCSAPLPPLSDGLHTITVTAVSTSGDESPSSAAITVQKVSATGAVVGSGAMSGAAPQSVAAADALVGPDGQQFSVDTIASSLTPPLQLAATPDGRLLVAEGDGRIRMVVPGEPERNGLAIDTAEVLGGSASGGVGVAVHPDFSSNHLVYVSLVSPDPADARLRIVRLREVGGLLGEPATVFEAPLAKASETLSSDGNALPAVAASARLAFGPDGLLYAMLSPGIAFEREPAASTPLPSIVRIDGDGHASSTGALDGVTSTPLGLAWNPVTDALLAIFPSSGGAVSIAAVERGHVAGVSSTAALAKQPLADGGWSAGRLQFDFADSAALSLGRAFAEELRQSRPAALRLAVPVAIDGWLGPFSGELMDVVAAAGTAYLAVAQSGAPEKAGARSALVLRLQPR